MGFPSIPDLPGVPHLARDPLIEIASFLGPIVSGIIGDFSPVWGVFDAGGKEILNADSVISVEFANGALVAQAPIEKGSFTSYNKVQTPFKCTVHFAKGGEETGRSKFLAQLEKLQADFNQYMLVLPEFTYKNMNLERYDFRREREGGAVLINAACYFVEVRHTGGTVAHKPTTKTPSAMSIIESGIVSVEKKVSSAASSIYGEIKSW